MIKIKEKVLKTVEKYNMIEDGDQIVLGLSGGVDSMALLYILLELKEYYDFNIHIAHLNHGVRGDMAKRDQDFVRKVAKDLGLDYYTKNVDMDAYAKEHKITSEEAGRILRYEFFNSIIEKLGRGKIAVAHNLNDQAETLLMRFLRGTGIDGLNGIEFRNENIIRPILAISREELEAYIDENNIEITEDHTNLQTIYTRNKIRLELMPYIQENFNPNLVNTMERTRRLMSSDSDFLNQYSQKKYLDIVEEEANRVIIDLNKFKEEHRSIQTRIIRLGLLKLNKDLQGFSEAHISMLNQMFNESDTGKSLSISNNIYGFTNYNQGIIALRKENVYNGFEYKLDKGLYIEEIGLSLSVNTYENTNFSDIERKPRARYFDLDKIKGNLIVRNRRPGDKFTPFGMKGTKKIKDYFMDEKIPREERDRIPIILDGESIIWLVGYRTSEEYRIDRDTKNILEISYEKI